jgi:cysteine synthase A
MARKRQQRQDKTSDGGMSAYEALIGNTPLVKLERLSQLVGRSIHVKMESLNPGGTGKDRAALYMIRQAESTGHLPPPSASSDAASSSKWTTTKALDSNDAIEDSIRRAMMQSRTGGLVVEGTSGSTGISLATLCAARGHACLVVLPDDQACEKKTILTTLGAVVHIVPNCAISNPNHYVNIARRIAETAQLKYNIRSAFMNQFENEANFQVHYTTTGPELWRECPQMDAFVMSAGTGGTIAGVGSYLKQKSGNVRVVLVDPPGSALYHKIHHGVAYAPQQRERGMKRHRYDTLAEGIGLDRMTHNFLLGVDCIDNAIRVSDQEAVDMAHWLLQMEGLWVGSSSAMNVTGAVREAAEHPPGSTVVTVICDAGSRHVTRFWNANFIREWGLEWPGDEERIPECLQSYYVTETEKS